VLLAAGFLSLTAENCILESKSTEVPLKGNADMGFTSTGTNDADVYSIDFFAEIQDIENDATADVDELVSATIEQIYWRLKMNNGPSPTVITGGMTVTRVSTGTTATLVSPTSIDIEDVGMEFVSAPVEQAGIELLTAGFDEYIDYRNGLTGPPNLEYEFTWSSSSSVNANFDWEARMRYTITGIFEVEVPEIW
jgi:hypothetical protein